MADNTALNPGSGGDVVRTIDRSVDTPAIAAKTQVVALDVGGEGIESLVSATNPVPISDITLVTPSMSMQELFLQLLAAKRVSNHYLSQIAAAVRNLKDVPSVEEPDVLQFEFITASNAFLNYQN